MNLKRNLEILFYNFQKQQYNYTSNLFNLFGKSNNFIDYCSKELNERVKSLTFEDNNGKKIKFDKKKPNEEIYNEITNFMKQKNIEIKNKELKNWENFHR